MIKCMTCGEAYHARCCSVGLGSSTAHVSWQCARCVGLTLAFNHIESEVDFLNSIRGEILNTDFTRETINGPKLDVIPDVTYDRLLLNNPDTDPDLNLYSNVTWDSAYLTTSTLSSKFKEKPQLFTTMHVNCRSIQYKIPDIQDLLAHAPVTVLALTETWIEQNWEDTVNMPGYHFLHSARSNGRGGGVGIMIKEGITHHHYDLSKHNLVPKTFECIFTTINVEKGNYLIGVIYRPPGHNPAEFNAEIEKVLTVISKKGNNIVLLGDFNIDLLKANEHSETDSFYNCMAAHYLLPTITRPTRITAYSSTLIDNIFTNAWTKIVDSMIVASDISDHLPIVVRFNTEILRGVDHSNKDHRIINEERKKLFDKSLSEIDWSMVSDACESGSADRAYELFLGKYKDAYDNAFLLVKKNVNIKVRYKQPWMTKGLLKSSKKKSLLYLRYLKNPTPANKTKFTVYRNKFKTIRIGAERSYYANEFCKNSNDLKKTWSLIRSIIKTGDQGSKIESLRIDGIRTTNPEVMAREFNNYFTSIAHILAEKVPVSQGTFDKYLKPPTLNSFALSLTSPEEILSVSTSIHPTNSKGIDGIDPCIAAEYLTRIAPILSEIINCSFATGTVPQAIKIAKIVPVYKKGEKDDVSNYRPISVLPYFSKFYEKLMYSRLYGFIEKSAILFHTQHGFQPGRSPFMSLLSMQDKISNAIENNEYSIGIFFDLAKAFDTVNHKILLKKLENYGIRGLQLEWFKNYLSNRQQRVYCNGTYSESREIKYGVPQGSNLGPLLFLIYINDLPNVSPTMFFILFADDTNVFYSHKSLQKLNQIVNEELGLMAEWFSANKLTLNLDKTNFILFKSHRKIGSSEDLLKLSVNGMPITKVNSIKFLGVYVDQHLAWKEHINAISVKIAKNTGILRRVSHLLPEHIRLTLYHTLIYPYLTYCNMIWTSTYDSRLTRLVILQKRAIRTVAGVPWGAHTEPLFSRLKQLKLEQIRSLQIGLFMFRYDRNMLPACFKGFFHLGSEYHSYPTRDSCNYRPIYARTNTRAFSIKCTGPKFWNTLPLSVRQAPHLHGFKKALRTYLANGD